MRCRWSTLLVTCAALAPAISVAFSAPADGEIRQLSARERVLQAIPKNSSILINITQRELPASPDILDLGKKSRPALERCVADNADTGIRATCAQILEALGDRQALPALRSALEDWDAAVRYRAIRALEAIPDPASFEPLAKVYRRADEEEFNKSAVLSALGAIGSAGAVQVLRAELRKKPVEKKPDRRAAAFVALWRSRHLMARATLTSDLVHGLRSDNEPLALAATEASAELRERGLTGALIPLLEHKNTEIRNKAAYALGRIGDKTAAQALLKALPKVREARMLNNIAFALERLDPKAFYGAIQQLINHKQGVIRLNAAFVVGDVKRPEGLPLLKASLDDPSDYVKTSAIVALGKLDTKDAVPPLEKFVDSPNLNIRQEAIYALNELAKGKRANLIYDKLFDSDLAKSSKGYAMRRRAAIALGEAGDTRVRDYLLGCYDGERCRLSEVNGFFEGDKSARTAGRLMLGWAQGAYELTELVGQKRPTGARNLAASTIDSSLSSSNLWAAERGIDLLAEVGEATDRAAVERLLRHKRSALKLRAAAAAMRLGSNNSHSVVLSVIDNAPAEWLSAFANILTRIKEPKARELLRPELLNRSKSSDVELALAAAYVLLRWDPEQGFFRFLDGLSAKSVHERELSSEYLAKTRDKKLTWVMRRALARETRPMTRDRLRALLDDR